jgi:ATP-binding cassette subfamily B protein
VTITGWPGWFELARRAGHAARLILSAGSIAWTVVVLAVIEGALAPLSAWLLKVLLDSLFPVGGGAVAGTGRTLTVASGLVAVGLALGAARPLNSYAEAVLSRSLRLCTKDRLLRRVNGITGLAEFENPQFHDRLRLASQSGEQAPDELVRAALTLVQGVVRVGGYAVVLASVWPPMAVLAIASTVPAGLLQLRAGRQRAALTAGLTGLLRRQMFFESLLTDARAAKEIRLFGTGALLHGRVLADLRRANQAQDAMDRRVLRGELSVETLGAGVAAIGILVAVTLALRGGVSVGEVTAFLAAVAALYATAGSTAAALGQGYQALLLFGAYTAVLATPVEPDRVPRPARVHSGGSLRVAARRRGIEFRDIWFRYQPTSDWVLRGASFEIPHRAAVGLVGLNGAGKSTLVKLLCRMYDPQRGQILWDGDDLANLDPAAVRARIGAVFQDFMTYDLTARENIGLGEPNRLGDDAAIRHAADIAGIHDDIVALPRGYDTTLSRVHFPDDGDDRDTALLSGGQWQRLALARAFLRDAELLILDEPSSGLDAAAEAAVHERLRTLRRGRTSLLISHRLGTLRDADRLVVIESGVVAQEGTHDELVAAGGTYARLFALQARAYQAARPTV